MVAEHTFRPPYFHRNVMNEFMGLIHGGTMPRRKLSTRRRQPAQLYVGHGPDAASFAKASGAELQPQRLADTLAFMFESRYVIRPTRFALEAPELQQDYQDCWQGLKKHFDPTRKGTS
jgi:homogentisate 1,2-dioxygenase